MGKESFKKLGRRKIRPSPELVKPHNAIITDQEQHQENLTRDGRFGKQTMERGSRIPNEKQRPQKNRAMNVGKISKIQFDLETNWPKQNYKINEAEIHNSNKLRDITTEFNKN